MLARATKDDTTELLSDSRQIKIDTHALRNDTARILEEIKKFKGPNPEAVAAGMAPKQLQVIEVVSR